MFEIEKPEHTTITYRQGIFLRYLLAILIDLMVLNLLVEYWDNVIINSFTISILAAFILQVLLRATMIIEHKVANYFKAKPGKINVFLRWFTAWIILFASKFIILFIVDFIFGEHVKFTNVITFIIVVVIIILSETIFTRLFFLEWMKKTRNTKISEEVN